MFKILPFKKSGKQYYFHYKLLSNELTCRRKVHQRNVFVHLHYKALSHTTQAYY